MKTNSLKRMLATVLSIAVALTSTHILDCVGVVNASEYSETTIRNGVSSLVGGQEDSLYFGNYYINDTNWTTKEPVKWRVLSEAVNGSTESDGLFLISDTNLIRAAWHNSWVTEITWENCYLRNYLNGEFINELFSTAEQEAVLNTTLENADSAYGFDGGNDTVDKLYLLSVDEANNTEYFPNNASRVGVNTAAMAAKWEGAQAGEGALYWLRTLGGLNWQGTMCLVNAQGEVETTGSNVEQGMQSGIIAVRPAMNLGAEDVLLISAAEGGKSASDTISALSEYDGHEWKLTLKDDARDDFQASLDESGMQITYSNAFTGENEYISAIIADSNGQYTHYGRLIQLDGTTNQSEGTFTIDLSDIDMTDKTLYIFNEQYNGDKMTDFASELRELSIPTKTDEQERKAISSDVSILAGGQEDSLYFGNYYINDTNWTTKEPVKWRVLSETVNGSTESDGLFLISDTNLIRAAWHNSWVTEITWENCYLRNYLNGEFINEMFSTAEQEAVLNTTLENADSAYGFDGGNDTVDKLYLLSVDEVNNTEYFPNDASRVGVNTAAMAAKWEGAQAGEGALYWLRTLGGLNWQGTMCLVNAQGAVETTGSNVEQGMQSGIIAVRPAMNLGTDDVLLISAANIGKHVAVTGEVSEIGDYSGNEWKLTLKDDSRSGFSAKVKKTSTKTYIAYEGANFGVNEYISVLLADGEGTYTHYGRLGQVTESTGQVEIDLTGIDTTNKTVYVFNEQYNGEATDYASDLIAVNLDVEINADEEESPSIKAEKAIQSVAGQFTGSQQSKVYLGNYYKSSTDEVTKEPVAWRVLSTETNGDTEGNGLFLISDTNLLMTPWNSPWNNDVTWETSSLRKTLNGTLLDEIFSEVEQKSILSTTLKNPDSKTGKDGGNDTVDQLYLLSIEDMNNVEYFPNDDSRIATNTVFMVSKWGLGQAGQGYMYWLRNLADVSWSGCMSIVNAQGIVETTGSNVEQGQEIGNIAVRPAMNLSLDKVLLVSAPTSGKASTDDNGTTSGKVFEIGDYSESEWKLTLKDDSRSSFSVKVKKTPSKTYIVYEGATTGANEYISVILKDSSGVYTHYGRLGQVKKESGQVEIDLTGIDTTNKTVYVFNEQYNGEATDYASNLLQVKLDIAVNAEEEENTVVNTGKAIQSGAKQIEGSQHSKVYLGSYFIASADGAEKEPVAWRVLSTETNGDTEGNGLFLISDTNLLMTPWNSPWNNDVTWETSSLRKTLNGTLLDEIFSEVEQKSILSTTLKNPDSKTGQDGGNDTVDQLYLLSIEDMNNIEYFPNDDSRVATNTTFMVSKWGLGQAGQGYMYWLRNLADVSWSGCMSIVNAQGIVETTGSNVEQGQEIGNIAVRPAMNFVLNEVLFTSAPWTGKVPADGKGATSGEVFEIATYTGSEWKLTLKDGSRKDFSARVKKTPTKTYIEYEGATVGSNEYISVILKDSNGVYTHYGRLGQVKKESGQVEIDLSGIDTKGKTIYIFNEQYNGGNSADTGATDYASNLIQVNLDIAVNAEDEVQTITAKASVPVVLEQMVAENQNNDGRKSLLHFISDILGCIGAAGGVGTLLFVLLGKRRKEEETGNGKE